MKINSTDQTWDAGKNMRAAELALDFSCLLLFRTVCTRVTIMQNLSEFICSPTEDQDNFAQVANPKRATLWFFRLWKQYFSALLRTLFPLLGQSCSLPPLFPLLPHSLSKKCMTNSCPSLGLEIYLNPQGELIPRTLNAVFLHGDNCCSRL